MVGVEILPKYYHPYGALGMCGLYGNNGKFNVTNGSSGKNGPYRSSGQRAWGISLRCNFAQIRKGRKQDDMKRMTTCSNEYASGILL